MEKLNDLLFVIGLFLGIIGVIVLGTHVFGGNDIVQGIRVNLLGGSVLTLTGTMMIVKSFLT
jgi:hypothetical protein